MSKLILFDIDGTLVGGVQDSTLTVAQTKDRFTEAIRNVTGLEIIRDKDYRGYTDYLILAAMLKGVGWDEARIEAAMPALLQELDREHQKKFQPGSVTLLPGVKGLLTSLRERGHALALMTGNLEPVAKRKLEALGIWSEFSTGGYGSDPHATRADLVRLAIRRAGFVGREDDVYVFGDTPKDIEAAHEAGVTHSVGVVNGYRAAHELEDAGASAVLEDLSDTQKVLTTLGLA